MTVGGRKMGLLVIGAGFLGALRAAAAKKARGTRLLAVLDINPDSAEMVARRHGVETVFDLEEALARSDIDAVVVATPHSDHFAQARAALEAGKHVLCEKPLGVHPDEARWLAMRADELGLRLATGLNHRFYPPVVDALALVNARSIGRVESARAEIGHNASAEFLASWHTDIARSGGGSLIDNGPHACDLIRLFLGEATAAIGYRGQRGETPDACESEAYALFRGIDHAIGEIRTSWSQKLGYLTVDVRGSDGWLKVEIGPWRLEGLLADGRAIRRAYPKERFVERAFRVCHGTERSLVRELEAFASTTGDDTTLAATGWDGCRATEMIDAVYRSDASGTEAAIDPLPSTLSFSARRRATVERAA